MFDRIIAPLVDNAVEDADQLLGHQRVALSESERLVLLGAARRALTSNLRARLTRLLVLELNIARLEGRLTAATAQGRFEEFLDNACRPSFWPGLATVYPTLRRRVERVVSARTDSIVELAARLGADRAGRFGRLGLGGDLVAVEFGQGDGHDGGRTVARVELSDGTLMYKPRSLASDVALAGLLGGLDDPGDRLAMRVPATVDRQGYGWSEFVEHRYCRDAGEVRTFYRSLGGWLALLRLIQGGDMHAENVIACGESPVVVDSETLFLPNRATTGTAASAADRLAARRLSTTVASTLMLPMRLGDESAEVDYSALGSLRDEQPEIMQLDISGRNTDEATVVAVPTRITPPTSNHPVPEPRPEAHLADIMDGFATYAARIDRAHADGRLATLVDRFAGCRLRLVPRDTEYYMQLVKVLWHPAGLYDEAGTIRRVEGALRDDLIHTLLPRRRDIVLAELDALLIGDVPRFTFTPELGRVTGPGGVAAGRHGNLLAEAVRGWRELDLELERQVIKTSLRHAYLTTAAHVPEGPGTAPRPARDGGRPEMPLPSRELAENLVATLCRRAVWGDDGTVAWIGTAVTTTRPTLAPVGTDLYDGLLGIALALTAYTAAADRGLVRENRDARAALAACRQSLDWHAANRGDAIDDPGAYTGTAGEIVGYLAIHDLTGDPAAIAAAAAAATLVAGIGQDAELDLLSGVAGSVAALVHLAERTGDAGYLDLATTLARRLHERAQHQDDGSCWWPSRIGDRLGGLSHGATGIGWALARLSLATGDGEWLDLAGRAYAFEESLYDRAHGWRDQRRAELAYRDMWCNGSTGIGLAHLDLHRRTGLAHHLEIAERAVAHLRTAQRSGDHSLCHGRLSVIEFLNAAGHADLAAASATRLAAEVAASGVTVGITGDDHAPGLFDGLAGVAYQLIRTDLGLAAAPSVLLPGGLAPAGATRAPVENAVSRAPA